MTEEQQLAALHKERGCVCGGTLLTHDDPLAMLVETVLDVTLEQRRDEAAITIRDLIDKYAQGRYYCSEHKYNPPPNSGFTLCPQCEIIAGNWGRE